MARVVVTALADADTAKVLDDLAGDAGPLVASNYNARIEALYDRLAYAPDGYQERLARRAQSLYCAACHSPQVSRRCSVAQ